MPITNAYERLPVEAIIVDRSDRQRRLLDPRNLMDSVKKHGVLNPIIVTKERLLIAGERRLEASRQLGLVDIPVRYIEDMDETEAQIIELEENLKRTDLHWRDEVRAVARIHSLYTTTNADWSQVQTANSLGMSASYISMAMRVWADFDSPKIATAVGMSAAYNLLSRLDERKLADAMSDLMEAGHAAFESGGHEGGEVVPEADQNDMAFAGPLTGHQGPVDGAATPLAADGQTPNSPVKLPGIYTSGGPLPGHPTAGQTSGVPPTTVPPPQSILHADFLSWAPEYTGQPFNFIHCDFPYGVNVFAGAASTGSAQTAQRGGAQALREVTGTYDDSPEVYWTLLDCLCANLDRLMSHSGHLMFWFSMNYYNETLQRFKLLAPSLIFNPFPLVWLKSDNRGILPDPKRGPRQVYETCLIASREDRLIIRSTSNAYAAPTDKTHHISTKPEPVLRYFMGMFVDETTRMLDPTCGSGSALRAAESLGARQVLGLEIDPEHVANARSALRNFRALRRAVG